ncbi:MAG: hypothetical protein C0475_06455, partial [Planctomyces sp.]|nr:hypothetical protein [Planctomyces sp.]
YLAYDPDMIAAVRALAANSSNPRARQDAVASLKRHDALGEKYHENERKRLAAIRAKWAPDSAR